MDPDLIETLQRHTSADRGPRGYRDMPVPGMTVMWCDGTTLASGMEYKPSLCITLQGGKQVTFGETVFDYGEMAYLLVSVHTPAFGCIVSATPERPYLGLTLDLDVGMLRSVMEEIEDLPAPSPDRTIGVFAATLSGGMADCIARLVQLLDEPRAIGVLAPGIMREICYRLLTGPNGSEISKLVLPNSHMRRIADAIHLLRENFTRPVRIEHLADAARLSPSSFHQHFKTLTSMTPLQYQKQLRLLEARRLMLSEDVSASHAAFKVGYESPTQFSREYTRMFGSPPKRDLVASRLVPA